jgi:hypothetical protein
MSTTMHARDFSAPLSKLESLRLSPAKANLTIRENRPHVGAALLRAINVLGLSIKEAAALLDLDPPQLSRWISGVERVQIDRLWATKLHGPFAVELACAADGVVVETTVTVRRLT